MWSIIISVISLLLLIFVYFSDALKTTEQRGSFLGLLFFVSSVSLVTEFVVYLPWSILIVLFLVFALITLSNIFQSVFRHKQFVNSFAEIGHEAPTVKESLKMFLCIFIALAACGAVFLFVTR